MSTNLWPYLSCHKTPAVISRFYVINMMYHFRVRRRVVTMCISCFKASGSAPTPLFGQLAALHTVPTADANQTKLLILCEEALGINVRKGVIGCHRSDSNSQFPNDQVNTLGWATRDIVSAIISDSDRVFKSATCLLILWSICFYVYPF